MHHESFHPQLSGLIHGTNALTSRQHRSATERNTLYPAERSFAFASMHRQSDRVCELWHGFARLVEAGDGRLLRLSALSQEVSNACWDDSFCQCSRGRITGLEGVM